MKTRDITGEEIGAQVLAAFLGDAPQLGPIPAQCRGCGKATQIPRPVRDEVLAWTCGTCDARTEARMSYGGRRQRIEIRLEGTEWGS
jgi:hypothetical protein